MLVIKKTSYCQCVGINLRGPPCPALTRRAFSVYSVLLLDSHVQLPLHTIAYEILLRSRREAQENGDYAAAFLLCAEGCRLLETLQNLSVTGELFASINRLYADTISRLEAALSSTCADFEALQYCKVDRTMSAADEIYAHRIKLARGFCYGHPSGSSLHSITA